MTRGSADLLLLCASLIWGAAFVGQSTAMAHVGPLTFIGVRFTLATIALLPFAAAEARRSATRLPADRLAGLVGIGAVFFLGASLQQMGIVTTTVTNAGFLTVLYVVMVPAIGALFLGHRLPGAIWPAAALSVLGTFLLGGGHMGGLGRGDLLIILGALFWSVQILGLGAAAGRLRRPFTITMIQFAVAAAFGLASGFLFENPRLDGIAAAWKELAYTGIVSGGLAFTLQAIAQNHTPPADAAIIVSTESLFAAVFGALLLGDRLSAAGWMGAGAVLAAALIVQLAPIHARRRWR